MKTDITSEFEYNELHKSLENIRIELNRINARWNNVIMRINYKLSNTLNKNAPTFIESTIAQQRDQQSLLTKVISFVIAKIKESLTNVNLITTFAKIKATKKQCKKPKEKHVDTILFKIIIKTAVNACFAVEDRISFLGEHVYANETLKTVWCNDVEQIDSLKNKISFSLSRYKEALYFKNKKTTVLSNQQHLQSKYRPIARA